MRPAMLSLLLASSLVLSTGTNAQSADPAAIAKQALDLMDAGDYAHVETLFAPRMAEAVHAEKLKAVWESLPVQMGKATGRGDATTAMQGDSAVVQVPLHFEKAELVAKFAIGADGKIAGFLVQPAQVAPAPAPAVAADASYAEREMAIGDGARALPATLSMPKGGGPFPAIVLVHGSGAHDRDETIGPNKPFLDIARGLAAQGVAVLRYEKRTKAHPEEFTHDAAFGVDEETTFDAVLAVDALRKTEGIDPKRVFVLGHSQGGMMAPRIAALSGHVRGLVLLVHAGLVARYGAIDLLERLRDRVGDREAPRGAWLLLAADEQSELPLLEGRPVPILGLTQRARVPREWLENLHRSATPDGP